jgi:DNA-binding Xre family transcriptional regulator
MPARARDGLDLVRALLNMALAALPLSPRKIEDALQIGHGTLPRLLGGRMDLKLRHLLPLCQVLEIHPAELLQRGLPNWEATRRIDEWLPPDHRKAAPSPTLSAELLEAIRTTVREEIAHAGLTPGAKRQRRGVPADTPRDRGEKRAVAAKNPRSRRDGAR